jgi:acetyl-CoA carboxylase biotin carboxylase subunit
LAAQSEAAAAFKDGTLYFERYIPRARHVEIQILADSHGNVIHLGERDCTLQRRHQKLVEESPSPVVSPSLRKELGQAAVSFAKAAEYVNAGTVEFLLDDRGRFYFIEMNARIQVEHPVTEEVTGVDIVKEQILISSGEKLRYGQKDILINGAAIECRINAEDSEDGFRPCPGRVTMDCAPGGAGVRVDSHLYPGYTIPPNYDSLIAKLIVSNRSRAECLASMRRALQEFVIEGVKTTIPLHLAIFQNAQYIRGEVDTTFIETQFGR